MFFATIKVIITTLMGVAMHDKRDNQYEVVLIEMVVWVILFGFIFMSFQGIF